jgi:predicted transcriptional regulator of viral defense system
VSQDQIGQVLRLVQEAGVLRPRELDAHGIPREILRRLSARGLLARVGRGLYMLPNAAVTEHHTLAEASKRVPQGVVCLLSALCFHGLTTHVPAEVWMALPNKVWRPRVDAPAMRFVRFSGDSFESGIEAHHLEGVLVRVYSPAKTVADCFKYRNKIGLDVALEALRDCLRQRRCSVDDLWEFARICRVAPLMQPYIEATL